MRQFAPGGRQIALEQTAGPVEAWFAGDAPFACQEPRGNGETRVAKGRTAAECAERLPIGTAQAIDRRLANREARNGSARHALNKAEPALFVGFETERIKRAVRSADHLIQRQIEQRRLGRDVRERFVLPRRSEALDPLHDLADVALVFARLIFRFGMTAATRRIIRRVELERARRRRQGEIGGAESGQRRLRGRAEFATTAQNAARERICGMIAAQSSSTSRARIITAVTTAG
jgi:hypothetical protein